jgi:ABC-type transport system involved in multi-copper enzyme maturation permease subunit
MIANVFQNDVVIAERRGRQHVLRWIYAGWLLMQAFYILYIKSSILYGVYRQERAFGFARTVDLLDVYLVQQLALMIVLVPTLAAGAVADEKMRGTLQHLLTTEISAREFIFGKLVSRMVQVLLLFLPGLPILGFLAGLAGLDIATSLSLLAAQVIPVTALVALSLLASVWCRTTRDAVIAVYALGFAAFLLMRQVGGPLLYFDPWFVLAPLSESDNVSESLSMGQRLLGGVAAWGSLGTLCLSLAIWRLRQASQRQSENTRLFWRRQRNPARQPAVGMNPVQWREQYVEGLSPTRIFRLLPRGLGVLLVFIASLISSGLILQEHFIPSGPNSDPFGDLISWALEFPRWPRNFSSAVCQAFLAQAIVVLLLASLIVGIRCSGAIVGEREKRTWDALLVTPLTARELVRGKLWAVKGASYPYLAAYALPAVFCSALTVSIALFYTVAGLAVTVLAMYYMGAAGLYFSVRSKTSWRSLLATLIVGYWGVSVVTSCASFPLIIVFSLIVGVAKIVLRGTNANLTNVSVALLASEGAVGISLCLVCWLLSRFCLGSAQKWIAQRDRVRRWEDSPPRLLSSRTTARAQQRGRAK